MIRKLACLAALTFVFGVAVSKPAPAAVPCSCRNCEQYAYCDDGVRSWDCDDYVWRFCA